jgi:uncharacterized membrane protein YedE/YeeE
MSHGSEAINALLGGVLIGLSVAILWWLLGRIAGISGILGVSLEKITKIKAHVNEPIAWRISFLLGLCAAPFVCRLWFDLPSISIEASDPLLIVAGLLVGFGTRLGSGCTSGHGVCGLARFSKRSWVSTLIFMSLAVCVVALTALIER